MSKLFNTISIIATLAIALPVALAPPNVALAAGVVQNAPSGLSTITTSANSVALVWTDQSDNETGFRIERSLDSFATAPSANFTTAPDQQSFTDNTVSANNTYWYRVIAVNVDADSLPSNTATAVVTGNLQAGAIDPRSIFQANPNTGYPAYYQDATGARVSLIPITGNGVTPPTQIFASINATNPYSVFLGFDAEAFYWNARNIFGPANRSVVTLFGLEASFVNGVAETGQEVVFERTLIKMKLPLGSAGNYTIEEPYGTHVVTVSPADIGNGTGTVVLYKSDVIGAARDFVTATTGPFAIYLHQANPAPPAGWIGDGASIGTVTGSPTGFNAVRITGPSGVDLDGAGHNVIQSSNTWTVSGRLFQPIAPYGLTATTVTPSRVDLAWTDNATNETGYRVERATDNVFTMNVVKTNLPFNSSTFSDPTVAAGTTYYYRVFATSGGDSAPSNTLQVAVPAVADPPNAPYGLTANATSATQVDLAWTDNSTDETRFRVERAGDGNFTVNVVSTSLAANTVTYNDTTVIASTTYFYRVFAVNSAGDSLPSNVAQASVPAGSVPPTAPSGLAALIFSPTRIDLAWLDNATTETGHAVERADDDNFTLGTVRTSLPLDTLAFSDTNVTAPSTYFYRVFAFNATGDSVPSDTVVTTMVVPDAPSDLVATLMSVSSVDLLWTDNSRNESNFRIERSLDNFATPPSVNFTAGVNQRIFSDNTVSANNTYYYRVIAVNGIGDSAPSNTAAAAVTWRLQVGPLNPQSIFQGDPNTGYPGYYQDDQGTRLALLPITGDGLNAPTQIFDNPDPANPYSVFLGFGSEAFYYDAVSDFTLGGKKVRVLFGVEASFTGGTAVPGQEMVFARTRIKFWAPAPGTYTVQHPYGTKTFEVTAADITGPKAGLVFFTDDVGLAARDFAQATTGPINRFLHQAVPPPAGWIGDGASLGTVTGSPTGFNAIRITGPVGVDLDGAGHDFVFTDRFTIAGRVQTVTSPVPDFSTILSPADGVAPVTANFTDTSTGVPTAWLWDFGDGATATSQNATHIYNTAANYLVRLTVTNAAGKASTSQTVSIYSAPVASFTRTMPNGLPPVSITFTDTSTGNPVSWLWAFGDGDNSTLKNPGHTYAAAGAYSVNLTVANIAGNATISRPLNISANLTANFTMSAAGGVAPCSVNFTDNSTGDITVRSWDFGDGSPASAELNPGHTYAASGNFIVTLTVTDADGSAATSQVVSIFSQPAAGFVKTPAFGPPPLTVSFTDNSTGNPTSWAWDFGDGSTSTLQNPGKTYSLFGTYTVTLTATNVAGTSSTSQTVFVTGTDPATLKLQVGPVYPGSVFQGDPNTGFPSYYQDDQATRLAFLPLFGDGLAAPTQIFDAADPANPYSVFLGFGTEAFYYDAVSNFNTSAGPSKVLMAVEGSFSGGTAVPQTEMVFTRMRFVIKVPIPGFYTIDFPYGTRTFDVTADQIATQHHGIFVTEDFGLTPRDFLMAGAGPIGHFLHQTTPAPPVGWIGDGVTTGPVTDSPTGFNAVRVTGPAGSNLGGPGIDVVETDQFMVSGRIFSTLTASFSANLTPANGQAPVTANFTDTSTGPTPVSWAWDLGDGTTATSQNVTKTYDAPGNYTVILLASDGIGSSQASHVVNVYAPPTANFTMSTASGPVPLTVAFTDTSTGNIVSRLWDFGDGTTSTLLNPTKTYAVAGNYTVNLAVTNPLGSANATTQTVFAAAPLASPTGLTAVANSATSVTANWTDNSPDETGFRIERSTDNLTFASAGIVGVNVTTFTDNAVAPATRYYYRVIAFSAVSSSPPSVVAAATTPGAPPAAPDSLTATRVQSNRIDLAWVDNSNNELGFRVERSTDNITFGTVGTVVVNKTAFTDTAVTAGTRFYYRVVAFNAGGDSAPAGPLSVVTPVPAGGGGAPPPAPLTLAGVTGTPPVLDAQAKTVASTILNTADGKAKISIPAGTQMKDKAGQPISSFSATPLVAPPVAPPQSTIVMAYSFGPTGAQFNPPLAITLSFDPASLPAGTRIAQLQIAWWDGTKWIKLSTVVDPVTNTITAQVPHFTEFAIIVGPDEQQAVSTVQPSPTTPPTVLSSVDHDLVPAPTPTAVPAPAPAVPAPAPVPAPASSQSVPAWIWRVGVVAVVAAVVMVLMRRRPGAG